MPNGSNQDPVAQANFEQVKSLLNGARALQIQTLLLLQDNIIDYPAQLAIRGLLEKTTSFLALPPSQTPSDEVDNDS